MAVGECRKAAAICDLMIERNPKLRFDLLRMKAEALFQMDDPEAVPASGYFLLAVLPRCTVIEIGSVESRYLMTVLKAGEVFGCGYRRWLTFYLKTHKVLQALIGH